jgi:hypothetical protein
MEHKNRVFNNDFLERMTRTHIAVPITIFVVYATVLLVINSLDTSLSIGISILAFFLGWLTFTWIEYQVHRHLFHLPITSKARERFQYTVHGVHHQHPKDKDRLAMPPILSISLATLLLFLFRFIMGDLAFAFLPGLLTGYAMYLLIHYIVHVYAPPKNVLKYFWINHSVHHHRDSNMAFGVSTTLWDHLYGTHYKSIGKKNLANQSRSATT